MRILTAETKIKLSQIKDLRTWTEDEKYDVGDISKKTGLQKFGPGDWRVPNSLGARAVEYTVKIDTPVRKGNDNSYYLKPGSSVTHIETIAKGRGIDKINKLINMYKRQNGKDTNATDWAKKKGIGTVLSKTTNEKRKAELHWYECQGVGKKDFKVKKWLDEK